MYSAGFGQDNGTDDRDTERVIEAEEDRTRIVPEEEVVFVPVAAAGLTRSQKVALGVGGALAGVTVVGSLIAAGVLKAREARYPRV